MLDLGIDLNVWPWIWLFVAVTFTLIEVTLLGGSFVLLPFGVSAFVAALLGFYDVSVEAQWAVFVLGGGALWVGFYRWAKKFLRDHVLPPGVGADRLVGMTGIVTVAVTPDDAERRGRISVEGETWGVVTSDEMPLSTGTKVRIMSMQGARLVVEPIDSDESDTREDRR
ncbi:MAG: NfeD family protein [Acidimicrobiia bacterium]|nr:NfeD family protein [Acidimicrobiia bacterium]